MPAMPLLSAADRCLDLAKRVRHALEMLGYPDLSKITCEASASDEITLRGSTNSLYLRQAAHAVAQHVPGVQRVRNRIVVLDTAQPAA
ncbi:BON domain-containing protein [Blastopirellula sp. JC732]|uniref:BON domain-containing protein n=1 Tax=Blastopirellula sediminis TaxID=2894196 RepID=A0A9X1MLH7_9BACT|nr:BON domain-containing protein [Blastopirellula sediminis]MCC9609136.1 BON domain-containing protein [Blastopirellula sediminis]MCC9628087.1 BON domain-containing protein [Blastopirellula sediminis]